MVAIAAHLRGEPPILLTDSTLSSQINFQHDDGADNEGYLVSMMGSGLALFDYDRDGLIDVYFLNGIALPPDHQVVAPGNALFRNLGSCRFSNVSRSAVEIRNAFGLGVAVGDVDNDGFQDIVVANFGSVTFLRNNGDGTLTDCTIAAGLESAGIAFGAGVAFLDMDKDGDLDLYVADYVDFTFERFHKLAPKSFPYPPGPNQFDYRHDRLFENNGQGEFVDVSLQAGIAAYKSPSMGITCGDFDGDDDTDIFVCSDARPNLLFVNDGHGVFTQEAELRAVAYNAQGIPVGSMGVDAADIDNDGLEDLFITDYSAQMPILFRNIKSLGTQSYGFEDVSASSRAGRNAVPHTNWGAGLVDLDNDGDRDLLIGNGHLFKWANQVEQLTSFKVRNLLLANNGKGVFSNVTETAGSGMSIVESSRGLGFDDLDNDGDIDCVVVNSDAPANFLENQTQANHNWVQFELVGRHFNRDGVGAKVTVECDNLVQSSEVRSGRGYQSHYGSRLHFGLGKQTHIQRIVVNWMGEVAVYGNLEINKLHLLQQP